MKVLQINSVCGTGSTGRIAADIHHGLKEQGHQCKIAYGRGSALNMPPEDVIRIGNDRDVNIHALMTRLTDKTGFYSKNATAKLIEYINDYNPDVIHLHNIHGYYINIEILFRHLAKSNKPVIWTLHDCWAFTGHCVYFDFVGCDRWKTGCYKCPQTNTYPKSYRDNSKLNYEKKKALFTSVKDMTIITPSNWLAGLVKQSFLAKYPVRVVHNGIDLSVFKPTQSDFRMKHGLGDKKIVLGVASPWSERKGLGEFIKLAGMLGDEYKIVLVGLNDKQRKGLPASVLGLGKTNSATELAEIYTAADVFVNPTFEDNYPTVNLEALACGTPVVTYDTGGSGECIDNSSGIAVEKGNIMALEKEIRHIAANSILAEACIIRAGMFDKSVMTSNYLACYESFA